MINYTNICKKGFSLVEVLMVIAILGIIISITIISIRQNVEDVERNAKLNVARSIITQAIIQYQAENICSGDLATCDDFNIEGADTEKIFEAIFKDKLKTQKTCGLLLGQGCFGMENYQTPDGELYQNPDRSELYYKVLLQNNISIAFNVPQAQCADNVCAKIIIDTNGPSGPNKLNKDTFEGIITKTTVKFGLE